MKALLFSALLVISVFADSSDDTSDSDSNSNSNPKLPQVTEDSHGLLVGKWFLNGTVELPGAYDISESSCCMPYGTVVITADTVNASQAHMTSSVWIGQFCSYLGINSTYNMTFPMPWNQTYDYLEGIEYQNMQGIQFLITELDSISQFPNGTQQVLLDFDIDYTNLGGQACGVILSKDTNPNGAFYYGVSGFLLILLVSLMTLF